MYIHINSLLLERISVSFMPFLSSHFLHLFSSCLLWSHIWCRSVTCIHPCLIPSLTRSLSWVHTHLYHSFCQSLLHPEFLTLKYTWSQVCNFLQMLSVPGDILSPLSARPFSNSLALTDTHPHLQALRLLLPAPPTPQASHWWSK